MPSVRATASRSHHPTVPDPCPPAVPTVHTRRKPLSRIDTLCTESPLSRDNTVFFGIAIVPIILLLGTIVGVIWRAAARITRMQDEIRGIAQDMHEMGEAKDKFHATLVAQMTEDRSVNDRRLRFIEEHWMRIGREHEHREDT